MPKKANPSKAIESKAVANHSPTLSSPSPSMFQFADHRPESIAQGQMKSMIEQSASPSSFQALQKKSETYQFSTKNNTGLPDQLKSGVEQLSGIALDDVKVHYNSSAPAQLNAHAFAQGTQIHIAPGQDKHLAHEAWHVVQQKQGRVKATKQLKTNVGINDELHLEKEADVMGAKALQMKGDAAAEENKKSINTSPLLKYKGVAQMVKIITPPEYLDPDDNITYEFTDVLEIDLTELMANSIEVDDPNLETFTLMFKGAKAAYLKKGKADIAADIDEVLAHLANPEHTVFTEAEAGHRIEGGSTSYESIAQTVKGILESKEEYGEAIEQYTSMYSTKTKLKNYKKLQEYLKPFVDLNDLVLEAHEELGREIFSLFYWLMPLHDEVVKGIDNKQSLMQRIKIALIEKVGILTALANGVAELPRKSLIRNGATQSIFGNNLATRSEIKTAFLGALKSGEKSSPRTLETNLTDHYHIPFVAGHLVADPLGGKNAANNLSPFTNQFNTNGGGNGIRDPEIEALRRLKAGKVIFYSVSVVYANSASVNWYTAVLPTRVKVRITDLNVEGDKDASLIESYTRISNERIFALTMIV